MHSLSLCGRCWWSMFTCCCTTLCNYGRSEVATTEFLHFSAMSVVNTTITKQVCWSISRWCDCVWLLWDGVFGGKMSILQQRRFTRECKFSRWWFKVEEKSWVFLQSASTNLIMRSKFLRFFCLNQARNSLWMYFASISRILHRCYCQC